MSESGRTERSAAAHPGRFEKGHERLWVYELKGSGTPRNVPAEGLVGVWPEPPWYYLFYRQDSPEAVMEWLGANPEWVFTSSYSLPYSSWQDSSPARITVGPFSIDLSPGDAVNCQESPLPHASTDSCSGLILSAFSREDPGEPPAEPHFAGAVPVRSVPIRIDPGIVFGSGLHPTTKGCLLALSELFDHRDIRSVVDLGTGTGILAIASALSGASIVLALDNNPLALRVASQNAIANNVQTTIGFVAADSLSSISLLPDLLVMNLEWPSLEKILRARAWLGARRIVLAGFLPGMLSRVAELLLPCLKIIKKIECEGWPTIIAGTATPERTPGS